jgi:putative oxidoreductase
MDIALLLARLLFGLGMAGHSAQKLFGWFGGPGIAGAGAIFEKLGFRPGRFFALSAALTELAGATLIVLGLLGPVGPALMVLIMLVLMWLTTERTAWIALGMALAGALVNITARRRPRPANTR